MYAHQEFIDWAEKIIKKAEKMLTAKQERFCEEYIVDNNAAQAAIRAGYSENCAKEIGCENLTKPNIKERIDSLRATQRAETDWDVAESQRRLKEAYDLAQAGRQPSVMVSAVQAMNKMLGLDQAVDDDRRLSINISRRDEGPRLAKEA